jgi:hypothetical protein
MSKEVSETDLPWNCCAATPMRHPETFSKMAGPSTGPAQIPGQSGTQKPGVSTSPAHIPGVSPVLTRGQTGTQNSEVYLFHFLVQGTVLKARTLRILENLPHRGGVLYQKRGLVVRQRGRRRKNPSNKESFEFRKQALRTINCIYFWVPG